MLTSRLCGSGGNQYRVPWSPPVRESLSTAGGVLDAQAESQLERDERWGASRFAGLEQFIYNYLTGGESAGERVRLKLQTPLYVTDALLEAAEKQMSEELEGAEQVQLAVLVAVQAIFPVAVVRCRCWLELSGVPLEKSWREHRDRP